MMTPETILGVGHIGIRVHALEPALAFYEKLGFVHVDGPFEGEPVVILHHPAGVEINLIVNAAHESATNVLMDVETRHAGYTHMALRVADVEAWTRQLDELGIALSGGPVTFPNGARSVFVRDPDRNVVELTQTP